MNRYQCLIVWASMTLAACGGSGTDDALPAVGVPASGETASGPALSRSLPGADVSVTPYGNVTASGPSRVEITLASPADAIEMVEVTALVGDAHDQAESIPLQALTAKTWSLQWPANSTSQNLLLRLRFADESVVETAVGDFVMPVR